MSALAPVTESDLNTLVVVWDHDNSVDGLVALLTEIRQRGRVTEGLLVWKNPDQSRENRRWFPLAHLITHESLKAYYADGPGGQSEWYGK